MYTMNTPFFSSVSIDLVAIEISGGVGQAGLSEQVAKFWYDW